jgi:hypothetical protein
MLTVLTAETTISDPISAEYRVMSPISFVPEQDHTSSFVTSVGPVRLMSRLTQRKQMPLRSSAIFYTVNTIAPYEFWR